MNRFVLALTLIGLCGCGGSGSNPTVVIDTSMGKIKAELYQDRAPITVKNFLQYVDDKHYDGTIFHRVIADFMIQGGGFESGKFGERGQTRPPIRNEADNGLTNERGTLAMARTNDPHSATDQFFINVRDNSSLNYSGRKNPGYAVFGKVIEGMEVVDRIRRVKTHSVQEHDDVPVEEVVIKSIRRVETKE